ncbi:hypothetical protein HZQ19_10260 [Elizabethkingia anophelis]|nr:hypothetical protein [Elizabethkingia anophelis]MCT4016183.1 hypothetical protein [Elizabethkingia anophelis]MCT4019835.1 hypothetical protein [Elizabethkingia anophelis]MCT4140765.1 hypothetical protein [Elizabethkingia anophelis]MCT4276371.1 hypothetical protein [Elizabethkingia anophelis]
MPSKKKIKIGFYYLTINDGNSLIESFNSVISHIKELSKKERTFELGNNKFCYIELHESTYQNTRNKIIIKSAKHSFRPNLVHKDTIVERENPKQLEEGEIEKSHIVIKFTGDGVSFILDKHKGGITVGQFINYLNRFATSIDSEIQIRFGFEIVVKENFLEEINNLSRVTCAEIIADKQLLGSHALNYSNRIDNAKHDIILTVKAKKKDSIEDIAKDLFAKLNGGKSEITKLRIVGRNDDNNEVVLKTDFIERQEYITAEVSDRTGEVSSTDIFIEINAAMDNFN